MHADPVKQQRNNLLFQTYLNCCHYVTWATNGTATWHLHSEMSHLIEWLPSFPYGEGFTLQDLEDLETDIRERRGPGGHTAMQ